MPPSSGILRIYPHAVNIVSGDWAVTSTGTPPPVATVEQLQAYFDTRTATPATAPRLRQVDEEPAASGVYVPSAGTYELNFSPSTIGLVFNPGGSQEIIDFQSADFPMGLVVNQLRVHWFGNYTTGPSRDRQLTNITLKYNQSSVFTTNPGPNVSGTGTISSAINTIIPFSTRWGIISAFRNFGFSWLNTDVVNVGILTPGAATQLFYIDMVYNLLFFQTTLNTPSALPGDFVDISGLNFDTLDTFKVWWDDYPYSGLTPDPDTGLIGGLTIPTQYVLTHTVDTLRFKLPYVIDGTPLPWGGRRMMITGTYFNGTTVPLANLNILLVDGSGVYQLVNEKRNDTYYDRGTSPVETVDLKIPDPYVKTGFF